MKLIRATDPIAVKSICVLVYGQPGSRKTSLAQTADLPFTMAFDPGIYRAFGRRDCSQFDQYSWDQIPKLTADAGKLQAGLAVNGDADYLELVGVVAAAKTLVVDTI